jgi:hypothetical protein
MLYEPWERLIRVRLIPHILRHTLNIGKGRFAGGHSLKSQVLTSHRFGVRTSRRSGSIEGQSAGRGVTRRSSLPRSDCTAEGAPPQHADGSTYLPEAYASNLVEYDPLAGSLIQGMHRVFYDGIMFRAERIEESTIVFTLPADVDQRPVVTDGAGTLGRQIASVYAAGGQQG